MKDSHKRVENIEVTPKLKLDDMRINKDFQITSYLQEFQYGDNVFQTTTIYSEICSLMLCKRKCKTLSSITK
jgi:hypothetical protein